MRTPRTGEVGARAPHFQILWGTEPPGRRYMLIVSDHRASGMNRVEPLIPEPKGLMKRSTTSGPALSRAGLAFDFESTALRREDAHFARDIQRVPHYYFGLGGLEVSIPLLQFEATAFESRGEAVTRQDRRLLEMIGPALRYRRAIRIGDTLPSELADGRPSWAPKSHLLMRAIQQIGVALGDRGPAGEQRSTSPIPPPHELSAEDALEKLAIAAGSWGRPGRKPAGVEDVTDLAQSLARVDWLNRRIQRVQQCVGELARVATGGSKGRREAFARSAALGLRTPVIWATARALAADMTVADVLRALGDIAAFNRRIWPQIAVLRAFALDVEPIIGQWQETRLRPGGPLESDLDALNRMVQIRYIPFDADVFAWTPAGAADHEDGAA